MGINLDDLPWRAVPEGMNENEFALRIVQWHLPDAPVIIEAGASEGSDTERMKAIWPDSTIYAFEPVLWLYNRLKKKVDNLPGVRTFNLALSDKTGKVGFNMGAGSEWSSLLEDNLKNVAFPEDLIGSANTYEYVSTITDCTSVRAWAKQESAKAVDFLWLDAEGAELMILKGAEEVLTTVQAIAIELNFKEFRKGGAMFEDVYNFLSEKGFALWHIWGRRDWQSMGIFIRG
jgi:FkbM family methyltransferase